MEFLPVLEKVSRTNDPEGMRSRILDAAAELFQANGYSETSMQQITKAAGVTSGALHHHYGTKKQLGLAVVTERVTAAVRAAWIEPVLQAPRTWDGVRAAFGTIAIDLDKQSRVRGCPLNNLAIELAFAEPDFRQKLQPIFEEWRVALTTKIEADESIAADIRARSDELATLVVASYSGAMTLAKTQQSADPLRIVLKALEHFFCV